MRARAVELEKIAPEGALVVHVIPLLVETGQQENFDVVVVVDTTVEEQLRRLSRRDGMTSTEARQRVAAQADRWGTPGRGHTRDRQLRACRRDHEAGRCAVAGHLPHGRRDHEGLSLSVGLDHLP